ncbi:MAG: hypothetical protein LKJ94_07470 [Candidatus Methanomethylophilus sp.]|nr:hypothetical protein [Methanomethylophilus sp.]MCI2075509.1 hypothetical protein [Methanomethylophilus sp.]MCI2093331.1 hypothetical protein [Methanomethylophilus sp.]
MVCLTVVNAADGSEMVLSASSDGMERCIRDYWAGEDCLVRDGVRLVPPGSGSGLCDGSCLSMVPNPTLKG